MRIVEVESMARRRTAGEVKAVLRERIGREIEALSDRLANPASLSAGSDPRAAAQLQAHVRWLGQLLAGLAETDDLELRPGVVGFGSTVTAVDLDSNDEVSFTLMPGSSIDVAANQVSLESPVGKALIGRRAGDVVTVHTPGGTRRFRIRVVTTLLDRFEIEPASSGEHQTA